MFLFTCVLLLCTHPIEGENEEILSLDKCVKNIIETYFQSGKSITFVDINKDTEVLKILNTIEFKALITRSPRSNVNVINEYYVIDASSCNYFIINFKYLVYERFWNPNIPFLILIKNLQKTDLFNVFDILLKHHVINALIFNNTADPDMYTYNPFENFACGRSYDKIIELGKCSKSDTKNLYPDKLVTGLKNCTFKVELPHWPPYTIDPKLNTSGVTLGIEDYLFREISHLEKFNINVTYNDLGDTFTVMSQNMSAVGPLKSLQNGKADLLFGGFVLMDSRADAFSYIYLHLLYQETLIFLVKKARTARPWKNVYLVFRVDVWIALVITFLVYFLIFVLLFRPKDKGWIILKMLAHMFNNGSGIRGSPFMRSIFIAWVWYAYLVCSCYQSSFSSIATHPIMEHQVDSVQDITNYNLQPCISNSILKYIGTAANYTNIFQKQEGCKKLFESIRIVSQSDYKYFTVVLRSLYKHYKYDFFSEYGEPMIYRINKPVFSSIYCIYFYKGFPLLDRLQMHAIRLRENGMICSHITRMYWEVRRRYKFKTRTRVLQVSMPWYLIISGYALSIVVFLLEILIAKKKKSK